MNLISARVENYKSVEDSTEFSVNDLTCLAGKNESGKTALLEALRRLNPVEQSERNFDQLSEYPRRRYDPGEEVDDRVLTTTWELSDDDVAAVEEALGEGCLAQRTVTFTKGYDNTRRVGVEVVETAIVKHMRIGENAEDPEAKARSIIASRLPRFLYFPNYGTLPGKVAINEIIHGNHSGTEEEHRHFEALLSLAGTSANNLSATGRSEELVAKLEALSNRISNKVFEYWSQNRHLRVEIRCDSARPSDDPPFNSGDIVQIRIRNERHQVSTTFDARSAGFVWFFSFLV